ncbi:MAG: glycoside hydrolase family 5 protein [Treponema sp.]|jgi:hypothetical protein|nr:glycoside hydrolase family 5 protein [Treponema sp.]
MLRKGYVRLFFAGLLGVFAIIGFASCGQNGEESSPSPSFVKSAVSKTAETQASVKFTLSAAPPAGTRFKAYANNSVKTEHPKVRVIWTSGTTLTLAAISPAVDVAAGVYYVSATEPGKSESGRVALTVAAYADPGGNDGEPTATPSFAVSTVSKTAATQATVNFTLSASPAAGTVFKAYANNTVSTPHSTVKAVWVSGTTLALAAVSPSVDILPGTYYVSATEPAKSESGRAALTVGAFSDPGGDGGLPVWHGFNLMNMLDWGTGTNNSNDNGLDVKESDFALIKQFGFNFIRLPVDYRYIYDVGTQAFDMDKIAWIDNAVKYGEKYGVHVNICLHSAPGYSVKGFEPLTIFTTGKEHFIRIWEFLADRYKDKSNYIVSFNLLNEPTPDMTYDNSGVTMTSDFKNLFKDTINAIRAYTSDRLIVLDDDHRKPLNLSELGIPTDNILQSPHCYAPLSVTHEGMNGGTEFEPDSTNRKITWPITNYFNGLLYGNWKSVRMFGAANTVRAVFNNPSGFSAGTAELVILAQQTATETLTLVCDGVDKGTYNSVKSSVSPTATVSFPTNAIPAGTKKVEIYISNGDWVKVDKYIISGVTVDCTNLDWGYPPSEMTVGVSTTTNAQSIKDWLFPSPAWDGVPVMIGEMGCMAEYNNAAAAAYRARLMKDYVDAFVDMPWAFWEFKGGAMSMFSIWQGVVCTDKIDVYYTPDGGSQQKETYYYDKLWYEAVKHRLNIGG